MASLSLPKWVSPGSAWFSRALDPSLLLPASVHASHGVVRADIDYLTVCLGRAITIVNDWLVPQIKKLKLDANFDSGIFFALSR